MAQDLAADGILAQILLIHVNAFRGGINADYTGREALLKFFGKVGWDWFSYFDVWQEAIGRSRYRSHRIRSEKICIMSRWIRTDWTKLGVVLSNPFNSMQLHRNRLTWPQLG